ncbi:unnamed protein product [Moneuplotes crassus]|uniref:C2 NT-type domain-containing protein n=1 Tax=Euplotes crassus TaxID=5936 RepID=A0AAD1Y1Z9_EUPCR|nr:unnamed protein product [Moneuplotes crassus]
MNTVILNQSKVGLNDSTMSKSSRSIYKYSFKFTALNLKSLTKKSASLGLCLQIDSQKKGKKLKSLFKKDQLEIDIPLIKDAKKGFLRKNVVFKVLMKSSKNNAKIIGQAICNVADLIYPPDKNTIPFEQRINLKFVNSLGQVSCLKDYVTLNLNVKSTFNGGSGKYGTSKSIFGGLEKGGHFNFETASQIPDDISNITESFAFDFDESMQMDSNFGSDLFEESPIRYSTNKKEETSPDLKNLKSASMKVDSNIIDLSEGSRTTRNQDSPKKKYKKMELGNTQRVSLLSQKLSDDTANSSHLRQHSNCGDINSEKSNIERDSTYLIMKEQFEREKNNCKIVNNQNEALLLQKADLLHKITQLQDQLKSSEETQRNLNNENEALKSKNEELINSQYANASDKLSMLANELEAKEEEMKSALADKSLEIQQIKTVLDAKQSQISKMNATLELKDSRIKTLEGNIKLLEGEVKSKSKEISTFEYSTKNQIESSVKKRDEKINEMRNDISMKIIRLKKLEEKVADLTKQLEQEKEGASKKEKTMQETINELKKYNQETTQMYKSKLFQAENELEIVKKDIESQKNRIYTAVDSVKADLNLKISERDVVIEKMKNQISIMKSKQNSNQSQERHWVIESNLRDIISEHKQKLIQEKTQREKIEKELEMYSQMLIKIKAEWANCEHEKEIIKFESLKKDELIEEYETEYNYLEKEYQKLMKTAK